MLIYANPALTQPPLATPEGLTLLRTSEINIQIPPGKAVIRRASGVNQMAVRSNNLNKSMAGNWSQGSGGGRGTGVGLLANAIYHTYLITNADGAVDAYFDLSPLAVSRPVGWDARMIGSFLTNAGTEISPFDQQGDRFEYRGGIGAADTSSLTIQSNNIVTLPTPSVARAFGTIITFRSTGTANIFLSAEADPAPGPWAVAMPGITLQTYWQINGNRMRLYADQPNTTIAIRIRGFDHPRGANG